MTITFEEIHGRLGSDTLSPIELVGVRRWLALARTDLYWMEPAFGADVRDIPKDTQFLLGEREKGDFCLLLPIVNGDHRITVEGSEGGHQLRTAGSLQDSEKAIGTIAYFCTGDDPYELVEQTMQEAANRLQTFRTRKDKGQPEFLSWLGWCTWDAFYHTVDEHKLMDGLASFQKGGVSPGFIILDDGGWDTAGDYLVRMALREEKFPSGLRGMVETVKSQYGVRMFGVWHAFQGYWAGIDPNGELADQYKLTHNEGVIRPWDPKLESLHMIHPDDAARFYQDLYRYLADAGIDLVKVDGQSALEVFTEGLLGRGKAMRSYQEAMQAAAEQYFDSSLIHSMCHGSDVPFHMASSTVWRNSQDYFPERPAADQQRHVFVNAMNNVWSSTFAVPDWDMFQTHQAYSAFHAAARAISGGPVYVCDKPGLQNFELLNKLTTSGGEVLRCEEPALPAADCLFVNCYEEPQLLKIMNRTKFSGVMGLFHCYRHDEKVESSWSPSELSGIEGEQFAVYQQQTEILQVMQLYEQNSLTLSMAGYELISCTPIRHRLAPLGLLDKFNSAAAVIDWLAFEHVHHIVLKEGGDQIGIYTEVCPNVVKVDGCETTFHYDGLSGLLTLSADKGKRVAIEVELPGKENKGGHETEN
jgi:raffinose synthase